MKKLARLGCVALLLTVVPSCKNLPMMGEAQAQASLIPLTIKTSTAVRKFRVEVARTEDEQARGLMFRQSLPEDGGMIFPMSPPRFASFWMKNTVIPLDMIFIRTDGTIARIAADTIPYSLEPVTSGEPVAAVLELAGGKAAALGIAEDDVVTWEDK
ncbi:DUF192 domain-containing protein [Aquisediminimonas profunda]|uniref:DUF192 domain-containing protein n=1 Tax=Aquisediminimonas profunda TaxID=1550733 RepID=UPI001C632774